jgi:hypothetical protein
MRTFDASSFSLDISFLSSLNVSFFSSMVDLKEQPTARNEIQKLAHALDASGDAQRSGVSRAVYRVACTPWLGVLFSICPAR